MKKHKTQKNNPVLKIPWRSRVSRKQQFEECQSWLRPASHRWSLHTSTHAHTLVCVSCHTLLAAVSGVRWSSWRLFWEVQEDPIKLHLRVQRIFHHVIHHHLQTGRRTGTRAGVLSQNLGGGGRVELQRASAMCVLVWGRLGEDARGVLLTLGRVGSCLASSTYGSEFLAGGCTVCTK